MEASTTSPQATRNGNGHHASADAQDGLFDQAIKNGDLEAALEEREKRNNSRKELARQFKEAHEKVGLLLAPLDIKPGTTIRVGRFRITKSAVAGRSVAFDTEPTERLSIGLIDND